MAALCVAARLGFEMDEKDALDIASRTYVDVNIHAKENAEKLAGLETLPTCCVESAECLENSVRSTRAAMCSHPRCSMI